MKNENCRPALVPVSKLSDFAWTNHDADVWVLYTKAEWETFTYGAVVSSDLRQKPKGTAGLRPHFIGDWVLAEPVCLHCGCEVRLVIHERVDLPVLHTACRAEASPGACDLNLGHNGCINNSCPKVSACVFHNDGGIVSCTCDPIGG
jgi:hypothetical protein